MASHIEESLQRDISLIRHKVQEMGERVVWALVQALKSLGEQRRHLAFAIILRDRQIDDLEKQIDRLCLEFLVRQQPVAGHLRLAYATIKVNAELERIGDYAESVARQLVNLKAIDSQPFYPRLVEIANLSIHMVRDAVRAFLDQDARLALDTMVIEEQVDVLRADINAELFQSFRDGRIPLGSLMPLLTIARRFERAADQAKNICEETVYCCTGEFAKHPGSEVIRILFVDKDNASASQMAEAIANGLGHANLLFSSAGMAAHSVDPAAMAFLQAQGLDTARAHAKTINQIPNYDHYQMIIALDQAARSAFPKPPAKTVCLTWDLPASPDCEELFRQLSHYIQDLAQAILGGSSNHQPHTK